MTEMTKLRNVFYCGKASLFCTSLKTIFEQSKNPQTFSILLNFLWIACNLSLILTLPVNVH